MRFRFINDFRMIVFTKYQNYLLSIFLLFFSGIASSQDNIEIINYIDTYREIAISEMQRTGIPASIKLAQGVLESGIGKSELAINANNHFGIKCGKDWTGKTYSLEDDDYDSTGVLTKSCFRVYTDPLESYMAHSDFLRNPAKANRYGFLFNLDPRDYKEWAYGLKKAGYATNPKYATILIKTIEDYRLYQYDQVSVFDYAVNDNAANPQLPQTYDNKSATSRSINKLTTINDVKVLQVNDGSTMEEISQQYDVPVHSLMKNNRDIKSKSVAIAAHSTIFLSPRRNSYRGKDKWHYVKQGENIESIARLYAIKESYLMRKNNLKKGEQPAIGERLALRGWSVFNKKPVLTSEKPNILPKQPSKPIRQDQDHFNNSGNLTNKTNTNSNDSIAQTQRPASSSRWHYHQVEKGDTLYNLSKKYNTSVDQLRSINNLGDEGIKIGQTIRVQ